MMTGEAIQRAAGSVFAGCAGGQAGVRNLAANGQDSSVCVEPETQRMILGVHGMELRMNEPMAVRHLIVVVMPVVNSLDFRLV